MKIGTSKNTSDGSRSNRGRRLVMKPRGKAIPVKSEAVPQVQELPVNNEIEEIVETAPEVVEEIIDSTPEDIITLPKPAIKTINIDRTMQFGIMNLSELRFYNNLNDKQKFPSWQYTAYDVSSGAVWLSYSYGFSADKLTRFIGDLHRFLQKSGISTEQLKAEFRFDAAFRDSLCRADLRQIKEYTDDLQFAKIDIENSEISEASGLSEFYKQIEVDLYNKLNSSKGSELLNAAGEYLTRYNYRERFAGSNLPPFQTLNRLEDGNCDKAVLTQKPTLLDSPIKGKGNFLVSLKSAADSMTSLLGSSMKWRRKAVHKNVKPSPAIQPKTQPAVVKLAVPSKEYEFVSLKNIAWKRSEEISEPVETRPNMNRNRQEIIKLAKKLLAEKRSVAELRKALPITEGELSMIQQFNLSDKEVRTQR